MDTVAARYYFDIVTSAGTVYDVDGEEFHSLEQARAEAILDARTLMSAAVLEGRDISDQAIEICNEARVVLLVVPFREAVSARS